MNRAARTGLWLLLAALILYFVFRPLQNPDDLAKTTTDKALTAIEETPPAPALPINTKPVTNSAEGKPHAPSLTLQPPRLVTPPPRALGAKRAPPPPKSLPFEMIDGWVVAFGDVLLGKPKSQDFPKTGFIEAPPLNYWETAEIPFSIHSSLPQPERVLRAISYFHTNTPVQFVPYAGQTDSVIFMPGNDHCLSYLGRVGGNQPIYLSEGCSEREIIHEIMHLLGFIHEHSRSDRDQYVQVNWENIQEGRDLQFEKVPEELMGPQKNRPFDFQSATIYPERAFAKNPELVTLQSFSEPLNPVPTGLSSEDIQRIYIMYSR